MADDMQGQLKTWQQLKQQAIDGQFRMEEGIGEALRKRCETFLTELRRLKANAQLLDRLSVTAASPRESHAAEIRAEGRERQRG